MYASKCNLVRHTTNQILGGSAYSIQYTQNKLPLDQRKHTSNDRIKALHLQNKSAQMITHEN